MPRRVRSSDRRFPSTPASGCGTTAMLALESAQRACDSAGVSPREISLLICKTTPDQSVPATSSAVAGALGIGGGAMDLNLCRVYVRTGHSSGPYLGGSWKSLGYRRGNFDANHELGGPYQRVPFRRRSGGHRARASRRPRIPAWLEPRRVDGSLVELLYADHGSGIGPIGGSWTRWPSVCAFPLTVLRLLSAGLGTRARLRSLSPSSTRSNRADCAMGIWYS